MFARVAQSKGIVLGFVFILCIGLSAFAPPALAQGTATSLIRARTIEKGNHAENSGVQEIV